MPAILKGELVSIFETCVCSLNLTHTNTTGAMSYAFFKLGHVQLDHQFYNFVGLMFSGWVDRVYAGGFAYWVGEYTPTHQGDRFGEGNMAGKRAMCMVRFYYRRVKRLAQRIEHSYSLDRSPAQHALCTLQLQPCFLFRGTTLLVCRDIRLLVLQWSSM